MDVISNWLTRPQRSTLPEPTALQALRSRQVERLRSIDGRVVEIIRDQEYQVSVDEKKGLCLKILLPLQFPQERPIISVTPRISHPWVSDQMLVVGSPALNSFMVHTDLANVIHEIIEEFRCNPPVFLVSSSVQSSWSTQNSVPSSYLAFHQNVQSTFGQHPYFNGSQSINHSHLQEFSSYSFLDVTPISSKLKNMSLSEIENLQDDDEKLFKMVSSLPQLQKVTTCRSSLREELERQAKENLSQKAVLEERKRVILEKYDQLNELRNKFDASSRRQDELLELFSAQAIQDNMKVAALEAEEEAEAIADDFLEGKISIEEFNKTFMARRTLCHLRRVKEEKCVAPNGWKC